MTNPLAPLLDLADVAPALDSARQAADAAMRHRALRRSGGQVAAEAGLRAAVASAALDGHGYELEQVRSGLVTDPVLQGALRVSTALDGLTATWLRSPRQVLARLHVLAARGSVEEGELGRPVADPAIAARLDALSELIAGAGANRDAGVPALLQAAVVHGELLALRAFAGPNGVVARAAGRLTLIAAGLDPRGLLAVDVGHHRREPEYMGAAGAFATGTPDGLRSWLRHYASAVEVAAAELSDICDTVSG
ncbi:oxidoreductase [Planosporangium mesophilum]|uniref:oxidoreductase n=1 Tax=Planosporangium mesophilum TaxID=689768 RepID=UPI00143BBF91|nr:oxidoreductase [Planosporangium mesophilum]NJC82037.1 oxidoreductase [Planosporangium mesophilum]